VTSLQKIDGSWQDAQALLKMFRCAIEIFPSLVSPEDGDEIFATIIGVAILRAEFQDKAVAWRMIEAKALKWLTGRCEDFEMLIDQVRSQVSA
jgi:hypothetical protein